MTTPDQVNGFFILPSGRSSPKGPPNAAIKVTLVSNSILPIATDVVAILDTGSSASAIDEDFAIDKISILFEKWRDRQGWDFPETSKSTNAAFL